MRNIVSPLSGFASPFGQLRGSTSPLALYAAAGITPQLVADFKTGTYGKAGALSTFDGVLEHSRAGLATMVDADGLLKWCPHNLLTYSEDFSNAAWVKAAVTFSDGNVIIPSADLGYHYIQNSSASATYNYTNDFEAKPEGYSFVRLFMGIIGIGVDLDLVNKTFSNKNSEYADPVFTDSTDGFVKVSVQYIGGRSNKTMALQPMPSALSATTFSGDGVSGVRFRKIHVYRSDLGGMADNPATGNSYVPTTSAAVYLPRENHHVWNGSAWVKEGCLHEPEAATNLVTYSQDFTNSSWVKSNTAALAIDVTGPDGETSAVTLADSGATGTAAVSLTLLPTVSTSTTYTYSVYAKADQLNFLMIRSFLFTTGDGFSSFDLSSGNVSTEAVNHTATIENAGNGWYRCAITFTTDGTDTSGQLILYVAETDTLPSTPTVPLDGTSSILIYGAQFEQGSVPTSYIPTSGSEIQRTPDILTLPIENIPYPEPVVIGGELVTNGTFDSDTSGWTGVNATLASVSGQLQVTDDGGFASARQVLSTNVGSLYSVNLDSNASNISIDAYNGSDFTATPPDIVIAYPLGTGSHELFFVAQDASTTLSLRGNSGDGAVYSFDNISVREINPLAVSFGYKALVTYADDGVGFSTSNGVATVSFVDWRLNVSNSIFNGINTSGARLGWVQFTQEENAVEDLATNSSDDYLPGINVPVSIASRHGSTFINGAVDGVALTANTTPTAFPDLSTTDLVIAPKGGPQVIQEFIMWGGTTGDIGDVGIAEASA